MRCLSKLLIIQTNDQVANFLAKGVRRYTYMTDFEWTPN